VEGPGEFYSARIPRKSRKSTIVDELLADDKFRKSVNSAKLLIKIISNIFLDTRKRSMSNFRTGFSGGKISSSKSSLRKSLF